MKGVRPPLRDWIPLGVLVGLVTLGLVGLLIRGAETPFGIGNNRVPDVVGRDLCSATRAITERGLRWGYPILEPFEEAIEAGDDSPPCSFDTVLSQSVKPGAELQEGAVVRLATVCSEGAGCR